MEIDNDGYYEDVDDARDDYDWVDDDDDDDYYY